MKKDQQTESWFLSLSLSSRTDVTVQMTMNVGEGNGFVDHVTARVADFLYG